MKVVHVQTTIQSVFGVVDDNGNVLPTGQPVVMQTHVLSAEAFNAAFEQLEAKRQEIGSKQAEVEPC